MRVFRITYKKPTGSFIIIESSYVKEDEDYFYLECGKYLKKNIIRYNEVFTQNSTNKDLKDDA